MHRGRAAAAVLNRRVPTQGDGSGGGTDKRRLLRLLRWVADALESWQAATRTGSSAAGRPTTSSATSSNSSAMNSPSYGPCSIPKAPLREGGCTSRIQQLQFSARGYTSFLLQILSPCKAMRIKTTRRVNSKSSGADKKCSLFGASKSSRCIGLLAAVEGGAVGRGDPLWQVAWRKTAASRSPSVVYCRRSGHPVCDRAGPLPGEYECIPCR